MGSAMHCKRLHLGCAGDPADGQVRRPIAAHNVTRDEVEQVLYARPRLVLKGAEGTEYAFGTTDEGRYLLIVLAESIDGRAYVVTARDRTNAERQVFRRKGR